MQCGTADTSSTRTCVLNKSALQNTMKHHKATTRSIGNSQGSCCTVLLHL
jgi:hypothetical protein